jgi:hypothetical protein
LTVAARQRKQAQAHRLLEWDKKLHATLNELRDVLHKIKEDERKGDGDADTGKTTRTD